MKRKLNERDVPEEIDGPVDNVHFEGLQLDARLLQGLRKEGFAKPTPVQSKAIPLALKGKDILGKLDRLDRTLKLIHISTIKDWLW